MAETETKRPYYNETRNKITQKYIKTHLDDIKFRVPKGQRDYYKEQAEAFGLSLTKFIIQAMDEKISRGK